MKRCFCVMLCLTSTVLSDVGEQGPPVQSATNTPYLAPVTQTFVTNKPRHVCWWAQGSWWAVFFAPDAVTSGDGQWHIFHKGDSSWIDTAVAADERDTSRPNVLYYNDVLWVYSCHPTQSRIYKYTYDSGWTLATGYPHDAPGAHWPVEQYTDTFTVDTNGWLWVFWIPQAAGDQWIQYAHSADEGQTWSTGALLELGIFVSSAQAHDKLYALRFDDGAQRLGLVMGNKTYGELRFAYRNDATAIDGSWVNATDLIEWDVDWIDDHFDALAYNDKVYLVSKTSLDTTGQPVTVLYDRAANGTWTRTTVWNQQAEWSITRPRIAIDGSADEIYVIAANHIGYADNMIVYQKSAMSDLSFSPESVGTPIISRRDVGIDVDNVCIAKEQICTAATGIYPVACDAATTAGARYYYWGTALNAVAPPADSARLRRGRYRGQDYGLTRGRRRY